MACFVSALTVRFLTRRFIGEYDENLGECVNSRRGGEGGHGGTAMPLHNDSKKYTYLLILFPRDDIHASYESRRTKCGTCYHGYSR